MDLKHPERPVLVTGASGYLAGWIVKRLLEAGLTVHGTVRDLDPKKTAHLNELAKGLPGTLRLFKADLLGEKSFDEAMAGCEVVFHTASPFTINVADPQRDLVDPALLGTRNVLGSADRVTSVKRVVLTSSCAAIYGDNVDVAAAPGGVLTEEIWNTSSSLTQNPYSYSKTVAEREAWAIAGKQSRWSLVVINPSFIIGPGTNPHATSESFAVMKQLGGGKMKSGAPHLEIGAVDVRDVAEAHYRAAFLPDAEGRHIVSGHDGSLLGFADALRPAFPAYPLPRKTLPKWLVWLFGPLADKTTTRRFVSKNVGYAWRADNKKSRERLGLTYRPLEVTLREMFQQLIDSGQIPRATG